MVDDAVIQTAHAALAASVRARVDEEGTLLHELHGMLQPGQRKVVADAVRAMMVFADGSVVTDPAQARAAIVRRAQRMGLDLDMDPSQQMSVIELLSREDAPQSLQSPHALVQRAERDLGTILAAFGEDAFDDARVSSSLFSIERALDTTERRSTFLERLVRILRPEQRARLASLLERNPGQPTLPR
jgi:hypothetical protein